MAIEDNVNPPSQGDCSETDRPLKDPTQLNHHRSSSPQQLPPAPQQQQPPIDCTTTSIILFYKYHALSTDRDVMREYQTILETLCSTLQLTGRLLIGCGSNEGLNGTLAGRPDDVRSFTHALLGCGGLESSDNNDDEDGRSNGDGSTSRRRAAAVRAFWRESKAFFSSIGLPELTFDTPNDFKWSSHNPTDSQTTSDSATLSSSSSLFPDLRIALVPELIKTGGTLADIPIDETGRGYLTPAQWHERLRDLGPNGNDNDTVLIDCRNSKEFAIGHFDGALDPHTTTFAQFPQWVQAHQVLLEHKTVLMYCTGGIRCEKVRGLVAILDERAHTHSKCLSFTLNSIPHVVFYCRRLPPLLLLLCTGSD
jgi:predicted sulfurtransferase